MTDVDHRSLAVGYFNAAWDLIDMQDRTTEQDLEMLANACASRQHWSQAGGSARNLVIADWQVAHAASVAGLPDVAVRFAAAAVHRAEASDVPDWLVASAHEGLARAYAAAGDAAAYEQEATTTRDLLATAQPGENRDLVASQLAGIAAPP
jgi:hypothetical protein